MSRLPPSRLTRLRFVIVLPVPESLNLPDTLGPCQCLAAKKSAAGHQISPAGETRPLLGRKRQSTTQELTMGGHRPHVIIQL